MTTYIFLVAHVPPTHVTVWKVWGSRSTAYRCPRGHDDQVCKQQLLLPKLKLSAVHGL